MWLDSRFWMERFKLSFACGFWIEEMSSLKWFDGIFNLFLRKNIFCFVKKTPLPFFMYCLRGNKPSAKTKVKKHSVLLFTFTQMSKMNPGKICSNLSYWVKEWTKVEKLYFGATKNKKIYHTTSPYTVSTKIFCVSTVRI